MQSLHLHFLNACSHKCSCVCSCDFHLLDFIVLFFTSTLQHFTYDRLYTISHGFHNNIFLRFIVYLRLYFTSYGFFFNFHRCVNFILRFFISTFMHDTFYLTFISLLWIIEPIAYSTSNTSFIHNFCTFIKL